MINITVGIGISSTSCNAYVPDVLERAVWSKQPPLSFGEID
jgi:hypothetical protein